MVGNFVIRRRVSGAVKRNFRPYYRWYTSPNEHFIYGYPHSNALFNIFFSSKAQHFAPNWSFVSNVKQQRQPITSDVAVPMVYRRIYWRNFLTLSNQTSRYIRKCIRMMDECHEFMRCDYAFSKAQINIMVVTSKICSCVKCTRAIYLFLLFFFICYVRVYLRSSVNALTVHFTFALYMHK